MKKHLGPIALSAAMLGLVAGGVYAGSQAFAPAEQPKVQFVQPAAQTVQPSPTTTVAPSPTATVTPKPVESTTSATSAPKVVQKKVTVAETPASEPSPTSTQTSEQPADGPTAHVEQGRPPAGGDSNAPTGVLGPVPGSSPTT